MRSRLRIAAFVLVAALALASPGCSKPTGPAEDGPPFAPAGTAEGTATIPTPSAESSGPSGSAAATKAPAPKDESVALRTSASAAAVAAAKGVSSPDIGTLSAGTVRLARAQDGTWWASVVVKPSRDDVDSLPVYLHREGDSWKVVDVGTGVEPAGDDRFPAEVRDRL